MTWSRKVDANQPEIVAALRAIGCLVMDLSKVGRGVPDILVCHKDVLYLLEIKTPKGKLNALQRKWHSDWEGYPVFIVRSVDDAFKAIGANVKAA